MNPIENAAIAILLTACCYGCTDSRVQRQDDEAMMVYRACMGGMSSQLHHADISAGLGSEHVASASAGADSHRDARQHHECAQRAGWDEN